MSRRWDHAETGTITRWFESHITSVQDVRVVGRVKKLVLFLGVTWTIMNRDGETGIVGRKPEGQILWWRHQGDQIFHVLA